jgi:hypothetical protein
MNIHHSGLAGPSELAQPAHGRQRLRDTRQHQITAEKGRDVALSRKWTIYPVPRGLPSANCGRSSVIVNHGALLATKT